MQSNPQAAPRPLGVRRALALLAPPLAVMVLIFALSAQPGDMQDREWWELVLRKLAHVTEYLLLALAWWRALAGLWPRWRRRAHLAGAALIALGYAATDELHQTFVDGRNGTPVDVLIDSIGIAIACALVLYSYARRRRRTTGPSRPRAA